MNKARNGNQPMGEPRRIGDCPRTAGGANNGMNGGMNNGMNGGRVNPRGTAGDAELLEKIRALSFVKVELELYLDTHPDCTVALEHYERCIDELGMLMEEYQSEYGPLIAAGGDNSNGWAWIKQPWPWHYNGAADRDRGRGV